MDPLLKYLMKKSSQWIMLGTDEMTNAMFSWASSGHPAQVLLLCVLTSDRKKIPLFFCKHGEKVGADAYY